MAYEPEIILQLQSKLKVLHSDGASFCDTVYIDGSQLVLWLEENNLPQSLSSIWWKDKRLDSIRLFSNDEIVAKHNYRRNEQLHFQGEKIVCYASIFPEEFRQFVTTFDFSS